MEACRPKNLFESYAEQKPKCSGRQASCERHFKNGLCRANIGSPMGSHLDGASGGLAPCRQPHETGRWEGIQKCSRIPEKNVLQIAHALSQKANFGRYLW